ncbi:hypothetical protein ACFS32_11995 [Novosphingobium pokkalii]|uniref:hypothetical protein n=1 Tax=Novosphingobium pokkalii TaxID=1770194 RepID=UPI0036363CF5
MTKGAQLCRATGTAMAGVALGAVLPWSGTAHARQVTPVSLVQQCPRLASAAFAPADGARPVRILSAKVIAASPAGTGAPPPCRRIARSLV